MQSPLCQQHVLSKERKNRRHQAGKRYQPFFVVRCFAARVCVFVVCCVNRSKKKKQNSFFSAVFVCLCLCVCGVSCSEKRRSVGFCFFTPSRRFGVRKQLDAEPTESGRTPKTEDGRDPRAPPSRIVTGVLVFRLHRKKTLLAGSDPAARFAHSFGTQLA